MIATKEAMLLAMMITGYRKRRKEVDQLDTVTKLSSLEMMEKKNKVCVGIVRFNLQVAPILNG